MVSSGLDGLVDDPRVAVVSKRRNEEDDECINYLIQAAKTFELSEQTIQALENLADSSATVFQILCIVTHPGNEDGCVSHELGEWLVNCPSLRTKTLPFRIVGFEVPHELFRLMQDDPDPTVRKILADHPCIPSDVLRKLRADPDPSVRIVAFNHSFTPLRRGLY